MTAAQKRMAKAAQLDAARNPQRPDFAALEHAATTIATAGLRAPVEPSAAFASLRRLA